MRGGRSSERMSVMWPLPTMRDGDAVVGRSSFRSRGLPFGHDAMVTYRKAASANRARILRPLHYGRHTQAHVSFFWGRRLRRNGDRPIKVRPEHIPVQFV